MVIERAVMLAARMVIERAQRLAARMVIERALRLTQQLAVSLATSSLASMRKCTHKGLCVSRRKLQPSSNKKSPHVLRRS
jgi:hypothetical protein